MFEGDSADTCGGKFPLMSMGAEQRVSHARTRKRGHPSARAEIMSLFNTLTAGYKYDIMKEYKQKEIQIGKIFNLLIFKTKTAINTFINKTKRLASEFLNGL